MASFTHATNKIAASVTALDSGIGNTGYTYIIKINDRNTHGMSEAVTEAKLVMQMGAGRFLFAIVRSSTV